MTEKLILPGDKAQSIASMLRVNHAGEYGAVRIYQGQLAFLKSPKFRSLVLEMKKQEQRHLDYFSSQINKRSLRPSILHPIWHVGGFALGALSAALGPKYAFACTVAVEEVISEHYRKQVQQIDHSEQELAIKIAEFRDEELEHQDTAIANEAKSAALYDIFTNTVKKICRIAIFLAKKY